MYLNNVDYPNSHNKKFYVSLNLIKKPNYFLYIISIRSIPHHSVVAWMAQPLLHTKLKIALCRAFPLLQRKSIRCHPGICKPQTYNLLGFAKTGARKGSTCSCRLATNPLPSGSSLHFSATQQTQNTQPPAQILPTSKTTSII